MRFVRSVALLTLLPALSGCVAAALGAAGAGVAAGVYLRDRSAIALVEGPLSAVDARTLGVLRALRVEVTETRSAADGTRKEYRGRTAELDVSVELEARGGATQVTATARRSAVEWDREYARTLVQRIVESR